MKSDVGIKAETPICILASKLAKKQNISTSVDFNSEVSKRVATDNTLKSKHAPKSDAGDAGVAETSSKPEVKEELKAKPQAKETVKEEPVSENAERVAAMQVQQLAISNVAIESKDDIPQIEIKSENVAALAVNADEALIAENQNGKIAMTNNLQTNANQAKSNGAIDLKGIEVSTEGEKANAEGKIGAKTQTENVDALKTAEAKPEMKAQAAQTPKEEANADDKETFKPWAETKLDLGKVNIKVADAQVRANAPDMPQQMADRIMYNAQNGKHVFDIELFPENMGKVSIKMVFENGNAQIVMTTHTQRAHKLMSQQLEAIKTIIETNTQNQAHVEVKASENASESFDRDNFSQQSEKNQQERREQSKREETDSFIERLRLGIKGEEAEAV